MAKTTDTTKSHSGSRTVDEVFGRFLDGFDAKTVGKLTANYLVRITQSSSSGPEANSNVQPFDFQEFSRAMLVCRVPSEAAIAMAIRRYVDVLNDIRSLESLQDETLEVAEKMMNRYRVYHRQDLESLGVKLEDVMAGMPVDPAFHEVVEKHPTRKASQVNSVALAVTPLMTWKDSLGESQMRPAKVVAYVRSNSVAKQPKLAPLRTNSRSYR